MTITEKYLASIYNNDDDYDGCEYYDVLIETFGGDFDDGSDDNIISINLEDKSNGLKCRITLENKQEAIKLRDSLTLLINKIVE